MFDNRIVTALIVVVGVPLATVAYVALIEWILERLPYRVRTRLRPWLWVIPALLVMGFYLIYPAVNTSVISFYGPRSDNPVGTANYEYLFTNRAPLAAMRNNLLWLVALPLSRWVWGSSLPCCSTGCATSRWPSRSSLCPWRSRRWPGHLAADVDLPAGQPKRAP